MMQTCCLQQCVKEPTRNENILDIFLTKRPSLLNKCSTIPGLGDQDAVYVETNAKAQIRKPP